MSFETRATRGGGYVAVLTFDADELRNIASALGPNDAGAREMLAAADYLDSENTFWDDI